jgi:hypothetical protein
VKLKTRKRQQTYSYVEHKEAVKRWILKVVHSFMKLLAEYQELCELFSKIEPGGRHVRDNICI